MIEFTEKVRGSDVPVVVMLDDFCMIVFLLLRVLCKGWRGSVNLKRKYLQGLGE